MNLVRVAFIALALLVPATWTIARAADEPPAGDKTEKSEKSGETKSKKSSKKSKKKTEGSSDTKSDEPAK